jgi:hypothetical protein
MNMIKNIIIVLTLFVLMTTIVHAETELPEPGITPDSSFYFLNRIFDVFRKPESVADRRASEMVAMAESGNEKALAKATKGYEKAIQRIQKQAEKDEDTAEKVARQISNHLEHLSRIRAKIPEQTINGLDLAINESVKGRENALEALERKNQERARNVAQSTLERVMANAPEEALPGLQRALEAVQKRQQAKENKQQKEITTPDKEDTIDVVTDNNNDILSDNDNNENKIENKVQEKTNNISDNVESETPILDGGEANINIK